MNPCQQLLLIVFTLHSAVHVLAQNTESDLIKNLLDNYTNPMARPVRDHSKNITVVLRLIVTQIIELNERRQEITVSAWKNMFWKDEFMTWDPEEYDNITRIYIHQSALWTPDVTLYNNVDDEFERTKTSLNLKVNNDGEVELATPTILKSFCKMNMKYFPLDEQRCALEFAGWIYNGWQEDIVPDTSSSSEQTEFNPNGIWNLNDVSVESIHEKYNCCPEVYPKVVYTLVLKRRERFFIEVILLPCCLLSALTMFVFLLPPESGEKMSFSVTTLLAILLFQQMIAGAVPPSADSTPIIQTYFTMLICMSGFSIICTVIVLNLYNRGQTSHVPTWITKLLFGKIGKAIGRSYKTSVYFNKHISSTWKENGRNTSSTFNTEDFDLAAESTHVSSISGNQNGRLLCPPTELKLILKELQTFSKENMKDKLKNSTINDWRRVAIFVDRVLFLISMVAVAIVTITVIFRINYRN